MKQKRLLLAPKRLPQLRSEFHANLCAAMPGYEADQRVSPNTAVDNAVALTESILEKIMHERSNKPKSSDIANSILMRYTLQFLRDAFDEIGINGLNGSFLSVNDAIKSMIRFDDYKAVTKLVKHLNRDASLRRTIGGDYLITPDLTVAKKLSNTIGFCADNAHIPAAEVDSQAIKHEQPRFVRPPLDYKTLHASISCRWTIRFDRSVSCRASPLNLIRSKSGKRPYIAVVTFEPFSWSIGSMAIGGIDCIYHGALYELIDATGKGDDPDSVAKLIMLVNARRLRDISDLPFDLAA